MVECMSKSNGEKKILPIFYDVEVDDVKLETDLYTSALAKHRTKFGNEVEEWEKALREVANMRGFDHKTKSPGELIDFVVEEVLCKFNATRVDVPHFLVGYGETKHLIKLLDLDSGGVRFVGIWGMGGIGKTTLAKIMFSDLFSHFDGASFLNDVRESSRYGFLNLQKKLLSSFVGSVTADQIEDIEVVMNRIKKVCETRKVLIVLDDIDNEEQLEMLVGKSQFASGSRIIITTRNRDMLKRLDYSSIEEDQKQSKGILPYELSPMKDYEAYSLLCRHAFKGDFPTIDYRCLAQEIVEASGGHPLIVEVLGSYLYCHGSDQETHGDKRELWEHTLEQLKTHPFQKVNGALLISFEGLKVNEKEVFLDIACFFTNEDQTYPVIMWDDVDCHPHSAIRALLQRSFIKIRENKFWMHDLLRDLGRHIIRREYPCKFSRIWICWEARELLERKKRNTDVQALSLTSNGCNRNFGPEELAALPKLRFLRVKSIDFSGNFENLLPELRWLSWKTQQATFYADNFHFNNLVVLDLSDSNIKDDWDGWSQMKMNRLKVLDMTGCGQLTKTPNFSNFLTLEMLILARCVKLTTIDSSIGKLKLLKTLNLEGCSSFGELPEEVDSLHSLTQIVMPQTDR